MFSKVCRYIARCFNPVTGSPVLAGILLGFVLVFVATVFMWLMAWFIHFIPWPQQMLTTR